MGCLSRVIDDFNSSAEGAGTICHPAGGKEIL